jgi:hypothetical protein
MKPRRWLDDPKRAPKGVRELLQHAAPPKAIDTATRARMLSKMAASIAPAAAVTTGVSVLSKIIAGVVVVGVLGAGSVAVYRNRVSTRHSTPTVPSVSRPPARVTTPVVSSTAVPFVAPPRGPTPVIAEETQPPRIQQIPAEHAPSRAARSLPSAIPSEPIAIAAPAVPVMVPAPVVAVPAQIPGATGDAPSENHGAPVSAQGSDHGSSNANPLTLEVRRIVEIRAAVEHRPEQAQRLLEEYDREHPHGVMRPERDYLAFEIARRQGNRSAATLAGQHFLRNYPRMPQAVIVRTYLQGTP